jgi:hypothetical protein
VFKREVAYYQPDLVPILPNEFFDYGMGLCTGRTLVVGELDNRDGRLLAALRGLIVGRDDLDQLLRCREKYLHRGGFPELFRKCDLGVTLVALFEVLFDLRLHLGIVALDSVIVVLVERAALFFGDCLYF